VNRYLAIVLVLIAATPAYAAEKSLERTFKVAPGGTLTVNADSASVHVSGTDSDQVSVRMFVSGNSNSVADAKLEAIQNGDGVAVTLKTKKNGWFFWTWSGDAKIEVTVPRRYGIDVHTSGGSVDLKDTAGFAKLHTSGGSIVAKNVSGKVDAQTSGGEILVDTIRGDVDADTSGGDVRLLKVDGKIRGNTSGGSVHCSLVGVNRGISATTSGGSIRLTLPRATTGNLEATTSGGGFSSELPIALKERQGGNAKGSLNGGGPAIEVHTSGGSISLHAAD
jgi:DUF4097 and DUF4098 domain-containing protein YvlB